MDRGDCILPVSTTALQGRTEIAAGGAERLPAFKDTVARRRPSWEEK